jgi:hypothetical protein
VIVVVDISTTVPAKSQPSLRPSFPFRLSLKTATGDWRAIRVKQVYISVSSNAFPSIAVFLPMDKGVVQIFQSLGSGIGISDYFLSMSKTQIIL